MSFDDREKSWLRRAGMVISLLLILAAVGVAAWKVDLSVILHAKPWQAAVMIGAVLVNLLAGGALFWVVTLSFDANPRCGLWRMTSLVSASALINYLPMRPGIAGRAAFMKLQHNLPIHQSMIVLAIVMIAGVLVVGGAGAVCLALRDHGGLAMAFILAGLLVVSMVGSEMAAAFVLRRPMKAAWSWPLLRAVDLLAASARMWIAFAIVGHPVPAWVAVVTAAGGMLAVMVGLLPNGLGMKEWMVAGLASLTGASSDAATAGLAAALVDRAFEAVVVLPMGLICMRSLARLQPVVPSSETTEVASDGINAR